MLIWSWGQIGRWRSGCKTRCMRKDLFLWVFSDLVSALEISISFSMLVSGLIPVSFWSHRSVQVYNQEKYTFRMNYIINIKSPPPIPLFVFAYFTHLFQECSCKKSQLITVINWSTEFGLVELKNTWAWSFSECLESTLHTWCELLKIHRMRTDRKYMSPAVSERNLIS